MKAKALLVVGALFGGFGFINTKIYKLMDLEYENNEGEKATKKVADYIKTMLVGMMSIVGWIVVTNNLAKRLGFGNEETS